MNPRRASLDRPLFENASYVLYPDRIVEGDRIASSPEGRTLVSNSPGGPIRRPRTIEPDPGSTPARLETGAPLLDALWRLALSDVNANINERGVLEAGAVYGDYEWVRDTAYSLLLGYDMIAPGVSRRCLTNLVDPGTGTVKLEQYHADWEAWPYHMTDSAVWVPAALRYALLAGDRAFLRRNYAAAARTLDRFRRDDMDPCDGLYIGNSSFFDGHNGYPMGYTGRGRLKTLSNNCIHYAALRDLARAAAEIGRPEPEVIEWEMLAAPLAETIRREFWDDELGYPIQIKYGEDTWERRFEALGAALYLYFGLADRAQARSILRNAPSTPWGVPTTWPDYVRRIPYHTASVWPFVAGFWGIAAARRGDRERFAEALASVARIAALELTFVELLYDGNGERMGSDRQLWSACGYLGLVIQGLFGITPDGGRFHLQPCVPSSFPADLHLRGLSLGKGSVDIHVAGRGTRLREIKIDGTDHPVGEPIDPPGPGKTLSIEARLGGASARGRWTAPAIPDPAIRLHLDPPAILVRPGEDQRIRHRVMARLSTDRRARSAFQGTWSGGRGRWRISPARIEGTINPGSQAWIEFDLEPVDEREVVDEELRFSVQCAGRSARARIFVRREYDLMSEWFFIPRDDRRFADPDLPEDDPMPYWDPVHPDPSRWRRLRVPMPIEIRIPWIKNHSVGWYRRHIHVPRLWKNRDLRLWLGRIHGPYRIHFNGERIAERRSGTSPEVVACTIPADAVRPGRDNVLAVRVRLGDPPRGIWQGPVRIEPQ